MAADDDKIWLVLILFVIILIIVGSLIFIAYDFKNIESEVEGGKVCTLTSDCGTGDYCATGGRCISTQSCSTDGDCLYGQVCSQSGSNTKRCVAASCKMNSDCPQGVGDSDGTIRCIKGLCAAKVCMTSIDCSADESCLTSLCTPVGETCSASADCFRSLLNCVDGKCSQCTLANVATNCELGQYCDVTSDGGICRSTCTTNAQCGTDGICVDGNCCTTGGTCGTTCEFTVDCSGDCKYCVNGVCTCVPGAEPLGEIRDVCTSGDDCVSGTCLFDHEESNPDRVISTCGWKAVECLYNNGTLNKFTTCPSTTAPFCVEGVCQASSAGSICDTDSTGCSNNLSCVNDICSIDRGIYGDLCLTTADCVSGLNCQSNVCVPVS